MRVFMSLRRVCSGAIVRIITTLHLRHGRAASNFYFAVWRWEVGNHNMWLGSFWYVNTQVLVLCTLHIFFIHAKLHTKKYSPVVNRIPPFVFPVGACFQHVFTRPCETRRRPMKTYLAIVKVLEILRVSLPLTLECGFGTCPVDHKPVINLRLIRTK